MIIVLLLILLRDQLVPSPLSSLLELLPRLESREFTSISPSTSEVVGVVCVGGVHLRVALLVQGKLT